MNRCFDSLFYKRLVHIVRVIDEDAVELERVKDYFRSISQGRVNERLGQQLLKGIKRSR